MGHTAKTEPCRVTVCMNMLHTYTNTERERPTDTDYHNVTKAGAAKFGKVCAKHSNSKQTASTEVQSWQDVIPLMGNVM